ncbi:hypothetical protein BT96DRAFT_940415 [Gymnopus androsaceus JB14]|uniref:FAD/NAD(P)-binding domain-containing protein n=1 Tax=Gymnopus androsaceus JB14 TaxID=1447944 RepID=A0A6A4HMV1_9AGAR|nr:hypothetical protein BT96DRAFT_940415 [Gymnopus androsaceus JB14]
MHVDSGSKVIDDLMPLVYGVHEEIGVETVLGQRVVNVEKVETVLSGVGNNQKQNFMVHLNGGGQLRADLVITCLGGTSLSEPLRTLAPSAIDLNRNDNVSGVFALGDVAHTGAHKAARPGHFQWSVVTRNIQRLIKADQARRLANGKTNGNVEGVEQITKGISKLGEEDEPLESYIPPDIIGIHLRLGIVFSSSFVIKFPPEA